MKVRFMAFVHRACATAADGDGGPQSVVIATNPDARRALTVTTSGGALRIQPTR